MKHIDYLLAKERKSEARLMWGRSNPTTIWISTLGYRHPEHTDVEVELLALGCRYHFGEHKALQLFDRTNGRTLTTLNEPTGE